MAGEIIFTPKALGYDMAPEAAPAAPAAVQPPAASFTPEALGYKSAAPAVQPNAPLSTDIGKTVAKDATKAVTVDVGGIPGSVIYYGQKVGDWMAGPAGAMQRKAERNEGLTPEELFDVEEGYKVAGEPIIGPEGKPRAPRTMNTMLGQERWTEENLPYTNYVPQSKTADIIGTAVRTGISTALTGRLNPGAVVDRLAVGAIAGGTGRGVGTVAEQFGPTIGAGAEITTNVLADFLTRKMGRVATDLVAADPAAMDRLAASIRASMTPERRQMLLNAAERGDPINVNDFIDEPTRKWLQTKLPEGYADRILEFEASLGPRKAEIDNNTNKLFTQVFGQDLSEVGWQNTLKAAQGADTSAMYGAARSNPDAANVWTPEIETLLKTNGNISEAAQEVTRDIMKGRVTEGNPVPLMFSSRSPKAGQPTFGVSTQGEPNFDYWDEVKKVLDDKATKAYDVGDNTLGKRYKEAAQKLRNEVSNVVPEYAEARAAGQRGFTTQEALEEGYGIGPVLNARKPNAQKMDSFIASFDRATPEIKARYQQGLGRYLLQVGQTGNFNDVSRLMSTTQNRKVLERVLGPEKYATIYGELAKNSLLKNTSGLVDAAAKLASAGPGRGAGKALAEFVTPFATAAGSGGLAAYTNLGSATAFALVGAAVGTVGVAAKIGLDAKEARVMQRVMQLATSQKPEDAIRLGQLLQSDVRAVTGMRKVNSYLEDGLRSALLADARQQSKARENERTNTYFDENSMLFGQPQASGGRVQRKSGGRTMSRSNPISAEVAKTRMLLANKTASMLSVPDDAIVSALNIAKNKG